MKRICTIAVRGGSKGVPGKNWKLIAGKPLFEHSILQAVRSGLFDVIAVTSDAEEVLSTAKAAGATHVVTRPKELASDTSGKVPAIVHAVTSIEDELKLRFETVVDLDATSPLRDVQDIVNAVDLLEQNKLESVITACESRRSPYFNLVEVNPQTQQVSVSKKLPEGILRRQDAPRTFDMNASIYVWKRDALVSTPGVFYPSTRIYEMPPEKSFDIDEALDFEIVQWLLEKKVDAND